MGSLLAPHFCSLQNIFLALDEIFKTDNRRPKLKFIEIDLCISVDISFVHSSTFW